MIDAFGVDIRPLEETDPEVAQFIMDIANKKKPYGVKSMSVPKDNNVYIKTDTIINVEKIKRNDPCPVCKESGKIIKWKKCKEHNS